MAILRMKRAGSFLGPVGLFFVSLGYTVSIGIARLFVTLESVCTQHCPVIKVQGFRFHHMYYGGLLLLVSLGVMIYASDARARWDSALVAGIGLGLIADEIGLLILKLSYFRRGRAPSLSGHCIEILESWAVGFPFRRQIPILSPHRPLAWVNWIPLLRSACQNDR